MKPNPLRFAALACCFLAAALPAQQPAAPVHTQVIAYMKVTPGRDAEYVKLVNDTFKKLAQMQVNAGEMVSWTFLRAVMPSGQEARADYAVSIVYEGAPPEPMSPSAFKEAMKKAGVAIALPEFTEKLMALATRVNVEMCRIRARAGAPQKGHYMLVNQMKVLDAAGHADHEQNIQRPMMEERMKLGEMSGWLFATRILTVGTDTPYRAYTADIFPTWQAIFASRQNVFEKVHPGKNSEEIIKKLPTLREIGRRDLWVVVERVAKAT